MSNHIQFSLNENGTAFVTLDRPEKKDALDLEMQIALTKIFQKIKTDPAVKRVMLDSGWDDHAFCAGIPDVPSRHHKLLLCLYKLEKAIPIISILTGGLL